jgi:hypothetical protein
MTTNPVSSTANSASGAEPGHVRSTTNNQKAVVPEVALGLNDVGFVRESLEKAGEAANASKHHPFEDEKHGPLADQNSKPPKNVEAVSGIAEYHDTPASDETDTTKVKEPATVDRGDREKIEAEEGEENVDYPSGVKLGLVTLGLCLTTFCIALDNTVA